MLTMLVVLAVSAPAPLVESGQAMRLATARAALNTAIVKLREEPTDARTARTARDAMRTIRRLVHANFHAANLRTPKARPAALALRHEVSLTLGGPQAVLVLRDDVFRFRPDIHRVLASASSGQTAERHLRAAVAASKVDAQGRGYTVERSMTRGK